MMIFRRSLLARDRYRGFVTFALNEISTLVPARHRGSVALTSINLVEGQYNGCKHQHGHYLPKIEPILVAIHVAAGNVAANENTDHTQRKPQHIIVQTYSHGTKDCGKAKVETYQNYDWPVTENACQRNSFEPNKTSLRETGILALRSLSDPTQNFPRPAEKMLVDSAGIKNPPDRGRIVQDQGNDIRICGSEALVWLVEFVK